MSIAKVEKAVQFMINVANNSRHGYDQIYRWGERGDYDCSSLTITAFNNAGFPVRSLGATYTGNMRIPFLKCGFVDVKNIVNLYTGNGLRRGDILLNETHHVAVYIGNGNIVQASINEKGTAVGGVPGDQTGREINISRYANYHRGGWTHVLRYNQVPPIVSTETKNTSDESDDLSISKGKFLVNNKTTELSRVVERTPKGDYQYVKLNDLRLLGLDVKWDKVNKITVINFK